FVWEQVSYGRVRDGDDKSVATFFACRIELDGGYRAIFDLQPASGSSEIDFAAFLLDGGLATIVEFGERDDGDAHAIAGSIGKKRLPEDVDAVAGVGLIQLFIQRTDEHDAPEAFDCAFGLVAAAQPFEHGDAAEAIDVPGAAVGLQNVEHGPSD